MATIQTPQMTESYRAARDAVEKETYLKVRLRTLRKYRTELKIRQAWADDPRCTYLIQRNTDYVRLIEKEIEKRIDARWATVSHIAKGIVITVVGGLILFFLLQSLQRNDQDKQNINQPQAPQQLKGSPEPSPQGNETSPSDKIAANPVTLNKSKSKNKPYFADPKDNDLIKIDSVDWGVNDDHNFIQIKYIAIADNVKPESSIVELTCYDNNKKSCGKETVKLPPNENLLKGKMREQLIRLNVPAFQVELNFRPD